MNHIHTMTRYLFALAFSVLLLGGSYGTALGQGTGSEQAPQDRGAMMESCPMMQDSEKRAEMMKNCPMMREMMADCPMLKGETGDQKMQHGSGHAAQEPSRETAVLEDGVQEVKIAVGAMGYEPKVVHVEAGVPARLVFTRTVDGGCAHQIQSPELGIETTTLPLNEPVAFEFTPEEAGTFSFACGMGMMKGTIMVKSS